jgi:hypothetical protein
MDQRTGRLTSSAGIWIGALAWATSTQLNYSLVPWVCASGAPVVPWIAAGLAIISLLGAWLSWRSFVNRAERIETQTPEAGTPLEMLAVIGIASGILFAVIIALQGSAALFLTGCEP